MAEDYSDLAVAAAPVKEDYSDLAQPAETSVSPVPEETHTAYIPQKDATIQYPASLSHDQVNDAAQTGVLERPRNLSFNPSAADITDTAKNILTGNIAALAAKVGEQVGENEPELPTETGKAAIRMAESIPKGVSGLLDMMGQNLEDQAKIVDPEYQKNLAYTIGKGMEQIGKTAFDFYKDRGENGFEKPNPEIFRGSFMSNPSVTRLAAGIVENVPLVAATAALSVGTGGGAALVLFGGMAGGESYEAAKDNGEDTQKASLVATASGIGNMVLMSLPIEGYLAKIAKGALPETLLKGASFASLGALMTPFNNITAKLGGDDSRKLFDGMTESLITMAASGFILGGMTPGRGGEIDQMVRDAEKKGVSPHDIDRAREVIAKQIQENPDAVSKAMMDHSEKSAFVGGEKSVALTPEEIDSKRGEIVKTIADAIKNQKEGIGDGIPEQFKDHHDLIDQALAENKRADKNTKRSEAIIESISEQYLSTGKPDIVNAGADIVNEAKQRTIDKINDMEDEDGKIRNRYQDLRYRLTKELKDYTDNVKNSAETTNQAIQDRATKEQELKTEYAKKQSEYVALYGEPKPDEITSVDKSAKSQAQSEFVREVSQGRERQGTDSARKTVIDKTSFTKDAKGFSDMTAETDRISAGLKDSLEKGSKVTLFTDGKKIDITSIDRGMMKDAKGQRWGMFDVAAGTGKIEVDGKSGARTVKLKTGEPRNGVSPNPIEGGETEGRSRGFEKFKAGLEKSVRERIEQHAELNGSFGRMDAAQDAAKGIKFVEENPERARRVALGLEAPPAGVSDVAVSGAYAEKMKREGNTLEQGRAELSLSLRGTRQGQELAARAWRVGDNSPEQFIQRVIKARQEMAGKKLFNWTDAESRKDTNSGRVSKKMSEDAGKLSDTLKSKQMDVEAAQKLLDEIKC